jgi:hypothetical protein
MRLNFGLYYWFTFQGLGGVPNPSNWILTTGYWNDSGIWDDNEYWID